MDEENSVNTDIVDEEEEEEESLFNFNSYTPNYEKDTRKERREIFNSKEDDDDDFDDGSIVNIESDDTIITRESNREQYLKGLAEGKIDTKTHSNIFNIEYAPEHLRGKMHWRNSLGDFSRMVDRAGMGVTQNLFNTTQNVLRGDMPAVVAETLTGDLPSASMIGFKALKKGIENRSFTDFFEGMGYGKDGKSMSILDAVSSSGGQVNNFEQFDAISPEDQARGVDYGLFGLPSLTELSGGYPMQDTGRWFADGTTNFLGNSIPFFAIAAGIMAEPTPAGEVVAVKTGIAKLKATHPAFRNFYNMVSKDLLGKTKIGNMFKTSSKFLVKEGIKGAGAGAIAETFVGDPYADYGLDFILPDFLDYENRVDDGFFKAKIKSMIVSEFMLGPLFGIGMGGLGVGTKGFREPVTRVFSSVLKGDSTIGEEAAKFIKNVQRKSNKFTGKNRNKLSYDFNKKNLNTFLDDAETYLVEPVAEYLFNTQMAKKIAESLGFTFKDIDEIKLEIDDIQVKSKEAQNLAVTRDTQLQLEKNKIRDTERKSNVEGREKTEFYTELADEKARVQELQQKLKEAEEKAEKQKNAFVKQINNSAKSEDKLVEAITLNNQVRPDQSKTAYEKIGVTSANRPKTPLEVFQINPNDLIIRPDKFQIKESGKFNKSGVSGSLADQTEFDPKFAGVVSVWKDDAAELGPAGKLYVIDGHNRVDLAKKSNVNSINVQTIEAPTAKDAQTQAAIININSFNYDQKGAIAVTDVAKIIRNNESPRALAEMGMSLKQRIVIEGMQLARLPDHLFEKLLRGDIGLQKGLAYGSQPISFTAISDVFKAIDKSNPSIEKIKQAILMASEAVDMPPEDGVIPLFADYLKSTNAKQLLEIRAEISAQLKKTFIRLKAVGTKDKKAGVETVAGNKIDLENTQNALVEASKTNDLFNAVAASGGETTQIIKELAAQVKGRNVKKLVEANLERIQDALQLEQAPLFKKSEAVDIMQEIDKKKTDKLKQIENESKQVTFKEEDITTMKEEPKFKEEFEQLEEPQQKSVTKQLKNKGKVTTNPSNITGKALPPLVTNPKARVFPEIFELTDKKLILNAVDEKGKVTNLSNFELQDAVTRTEKFKLTTKQIKNIQAKKPKYEKANAIYEELEKQINDLLSGKGKQGKLIELDPDAAETELDKLMAAREAADIERTKYVDDRLRFHSRHMALVNQLKSRELEPAVNNRREESIANREEKKRLKEVQELKEAIDYKKARGDYKTKKGYNLDEAHKLDNFTFTQYGVELEGMRDTQGKGYNRFYFGKPSPRYNSEVIDFISDLDIAIYTVAKQIANGSSKKSKSHYKYVELLNDLGLTNNQIMTRYQEIITELKTGNLTIEPPENYFSSKLLRVISDLDTEMKDIDGRYSYEIDPEDIVSGRVDKAKKDLDNKINQEYRDVNNPKKPTEGDLLEPREGDYYELIEPQGGDLGSDEIYLTLAGYQRSQVQGLMQEVEKISGIDFKLVSDPIIGVAGEKAAKEYGVPVGTKMPARGFYRSGEDPIKDLIVLSMVHGQDFASFSALSETAYHEAFHRLFNRYFTKQEKELLIGALPQLRELAALTKPKMHDKIFGLNGKKPLGTEEVISVAASGYKSAKSLYEKKIGKWGKVLDKVENIVIRVKNFLQGKGFQTWQDLFDDSFSGKIKSRGLAVQEGNIKDSPIETTMFETDPVELNNLFKENLEGLTDGSIKLEDAMSNVLRPLINRKWQTKGAKYFIDTSNKEFIAANKAINQAMQETVDALMNPSTDFPEIPSIHLNELNKMAMQLIDDVDGNVDEVIKIFRQATKGDSMAMKDLTSFAAVRLMRDGTTDMYAVAAKNYEADPSPQNAQFLISTFESSAKLNKAYATWGRASGQRLQMMGRPVDFNGEQITINVMSSQQTITMRGESGSVQDAMSNGLKETDEGLGSGAYFTSETKPNSVTGDDVLTGSLKNTDIADLVEAGVGLKQILQDRKVNVNFNKTLSKTQKKAINEYIAELGVDGIRLKGSDLGLDGDIIYIPEINKANKVIGSNAEMTPEAERPIGLNRETFEASLAQGTNILKKMLDDETYESIFSGEPNTKAREVLQLLAEVNPYITDKTHGSRIMRHLNKTFEQYSNSSKGAITQDTFVSIFRNCIFLGIETFMKVAVGNNVRAVLLPLQKNAGANVGRIGNRLTGNLNDYETTAMSVREQLQGLFGHRGYLRSQSKMFQALYLSMMSFKHNTNFGNIGKGQFEGGRFSGNKGMKRFTVENQADLPFDYQPPNSQLIKEQPRGDEYWLNPDKNGLALFMHRVGSTFGNFSSRMFGSLDTLITTGTAIAQEEIRHMENILMKMYSQGIDITTPAAINKANLEAKELTRKSMIDVEMANGDVIKGGYFTSENMRQTTEYLSFTDDINVKRNKRTREYGMRRAQEAGITDPMEQMEFVNQYLKLPDAVSNKEGMDEANALLSGGAQESQPFGASVSGKRPNEINSFQTNLTNLPANLVGTITDRLPITGAIFPVNRTPNNIIKGVLRMMPVANQAVDSYWRDINSEDLFVRENAIGEMVSGMFFAGAGVSLLASGAIDVQAGYGFNRKKRQMYIDQRRPAWSIRFRKFDGTYSEWFSLEAFDTFGTILGIASNFRENLNTMPIEQFVKTKDLNYSKIDQNDALGAEDRAKAYEINQDVAIIASAHAIRIAKTLQNTAVDTFNQQMDKGLFKSLSDIQRLMSDFLQGDSVMNNYVVGSRGRVSDFARRTMYGYVPQILRDARIGIDNKRRVAANSTNENPVWAFVENFWNQLGTQLPITSLGYTVDIDEIMGQPKTYATSYNWESIDSPIHRALLSTLNPLEVFRPTQQKDYGIAGVIYGELNRLHGKGAYPRFIGRNFLNVSSGQKLDDVQFNRVKEIFATEVKLDVVGAGIPMNFSEALYYLITQNEDYLLSRDIDPSKIATSRAKPKGVTGENFEFPERISDRRTLTKLQLIMNVAKEYKKITKIKYLNEIKEGNGSTQQELSLKEYEQRKLATINRDSEPVYGVGVNLNEWREIINS